MTQTTTLIATARNEGPFVLEWVAYHRAIGFDRIIILSDTCADGSDALLAALDQAGVITHVPKISQNAAAAKGHRNRAYAHALAMPVVQSSDWVMDVISPNWRIFGHAGQADFTDQPVLTTFTRANPDDTVLHDKHLGLKSMFRPAPVTRIGPHRPQLNGQHTSGQVPTVWRNGSGEDITDAVLLKGWAATRKTRGADLAQINHYMIRSNAVFALHNLTDPPAGRTPRPKPWQSCAKTPTSISHIKPPSPVSPI